MTHSCTKAWIVTMARKLGKRHEVAIASELAQMIAKAQCWPLEAQRELARLALQIEAGIYGRSLRIQYAGEAPAPVSVSESPDRQLVLNTAALDYTYSPPNNEPLSPPELFARLSAAARLGVDALIAVYASNNDAIRGLHSNAILRRGRIGSKNPLEALTLAKVSTILNDVTFLSPKWGKRLAMLSASEVFGSNTKYSVGIPDTVPDDVAKQIAESPSLILYYTIPADEPMTAWLRDLAPFIETGRLLVEPARSVFYVTGYDDKNNRVWNSVGVPPDSPPDQWNVHHTGRGVSEETPADLSQKEKLLFDMVVPYVEGVSTSDLVQILADESELLVEFRGSLAELAIQLEKDSRSLNQFNNDVIQPKVARLERRFRQIANMTRLRVGGALVGTATVGLVSYLTSGLAASIAAVAGASGLIYLTREIAGGIADLSSLKDDSSAFLFWKLRNLKEKGANRQKPTADA